jgi:hypothetical protein
MPEFAFSSARVLGVFTRAQEMLEALWKRYCLKTRTVL